MAIKVFGQNKDGVVMQANDYGYKDLGLEGRIGMANTKCVSFTYLNEQYFVVYGGRQVIKEGYTDKSSTADIYKYNNDTGAWSIAYTVSN